MRTTDSERYIQGWPEGNDRHDKVVTPELYAHPWFFLLTLTPNHMRTTPQQPTRSVGTTALRAIESLIENHPISYHMNNLHSMMVGFLKFRHNDPEMESRQEEIYHTYVQLKYLLTTLDDELEGQNITPLP